MGELEPFEDVSLEIEQLAYPFEGDRGKIFIYFYYGMVPLKDVLNIFH
jgi:hypothetical protein